MFETPGRRSSKRAAILARGARVVVAAVALAGCRGVLGVDGYGTLPPDAAPPSCQTCMDAHCFGQTTDCAGEPACAALSACLAACGPDDASCKVTCNLSIRRTSEMSRVIECAARSCDQCAVGHATFGGLACTKCLEANAPDTLKALSTSISALELEACQQDCSPKFEQECACTDYTGAGTADGGLDGAKILASLRTSVPRCSGACLVTPDWSCLGNVQSPSLVKSVPGPLLLHVRVAPYEETLMPGSPRPLVDAEVTVCPDGVPCSSPLVPPAKTQAGTGLADFTLQPMRFGPYFGHLAVSWEEGTPPQTSTALLYFFPPLRRSPSWTWRRVVSRTTAKNIVKNSFGEALVLDWSHYGGIVWSVAACNGVPAPGVTVNLEGVGPGLFLTEDFALSDKLNETSSIGLGAFLNVAPGQKQITLRLRETDQVIGTYDFLVETGAITTLSFAPYVNGSP